MKLGRGRAASTVKQAAAGLTAILLFAFALELMKSGASGLTPLLQGHLDIEHAADCLGLGWLMACIVLSGSPAAAIAMVLLSAETLTPVQTFAMLTGSRLGASFIVLLLGFLYALRGHEPWTVLSTGVLSLLLTASVQLSALPVGVFILKRDWLRVFHAPGLITREVMDQACAVDYDIVVIGSRGRRGIKRLVAGSRARTILGCLATSVLVVKGQPHNVMNNILVCSAAGPTSENTTKFAAKRPILIVRQDS